MSETLIYRLGLNLMVYFAAIWFRLENQSARNNTPTKSGGPAINRAIFHSRYNLKKKMKLAVITKNSSPPIPIQTSLIFPNHPSQLNRSSGYVNFFIPCYTIGLVYNPKHGFFANRWNFPQDHLACLCGVSYFWV